MTLLNYFKNSLPTAKDTGSVKCHKTSQCRSALKASAQYSGALRTGTTAFGSKNILTSHHYCRLLWVLGENETLLS